MPHGYTIIYGNSIELRSEAAQLLDSGLDFLSDLMEMNMSRNKLSERIHDSNDRLTELTILHTIRSPESSGSCHLRTDCTLTASEFFHNKKKYRLQLLPNGVADDLY